MLQARGDCARTWARRQGRPRHPQSPHVCWSVALRTPFSKSEEGDPSPYPAGESQCPTPLVPLTSPSPGDSPRRPPVPRPQTRLPGPPSSESDPVALGSESRPRLHLRLAPTVAGSSPPRGKTKHAARKVGARLRPAPNSRGVHLALQPLGFPCRSLGWHHLPRAGERAPGAGRGVAERAPRPPPPFPHPRLSGRGALSTPGRGRRHLPGSEGATHRAPGPAVLQVWPPPPPPTRPRLFPRPPNPPPGSPRPGS